MHRPPMTIEGLAHRGLAWEIKKPSAAAIRVRGRPLFAPLERRCAYYCSRVNSYVVEYAAMHFEDQVPHHDRR